MKILGILSIVFGGVYFLLTTLYTIGTFASMATYQTLIRSASQTPLPGSQTYLYQQALLLMQKTITYGMVIYGLEILFSLVLIVIGIGLIRQSMRARKAALLWAIAGLAFIVIRIVVALVFVLPLQTKYGLYGSSSANSITYIISFALGALIELPFPIVLLALLGKKSAKE